MQSLLQNVHQVFYLFSVRPSFFTVISLMTNFLALPTLVVGNSSTKR